MENVGSPLHVAIIPDGNRRWAKEKGLKKTVGHVMAGSYKNINSLFSAARDIGVKYLSIWGFSTENWKREQSEVEEIISVISRGLDKFLEQVHKEKVRFVHVGRKDRLPSNFVEKLKFLESESKDYSDFVAILCLDYGGRDEIVRAVKKIVSEGNEIDESSFLSYLDTSGIPEPELVIRTGGEKRLSGFMPYQSTYSEFYFSDKFFPDFGPAELKEAVEDFVKRNRRFGGD